MIIGPNTVKDKLLFGYDTTLENRFYAGPPAVNVFPNPVNLNYGRITSNAASYTEFSSGGPFNNAYVRLTRTGSTITTAWDWQIYNSSPGYPDGTLHTFSFYARSLDNSTATIKMSNPDVESQYFNLTSEWQRFVGLFTLGAQISGALYLRINRSNQSTVVGSNFDISMGQIEWTDYVTPFVDGTRSATSTLYDLKSRSAVDLSNVSFVDGKVFFDNSTSDKLQFSVPSLDLATNVTVSYWVKLTWGGTWTPFVSKYMGTNRIFKTWVGNDRGLDIELNVNQVKPFYTLPSADYPNDSWVNCCVTFSTTNGCKCYVNGELKNTTSYNLSVVQDTSTPLTLGWDNTSNYGNGYIDQILVYGKELSANEIMQNYNALKDRFE